MASSTERCSLNEFDALGTFVRCRFVDSRAWTHGDILWEEAVTGNGSENTVNLPVGFGLEELADGSYNSRKHRGGHRFLCQSRSLDPTRI